MRYLPLAGDSLITHQVFLLWRPRDSFPWTLFCAGTGSGDWTSGLSFVRRAQITISVAHWTSLLKQVSNEVH
jgi:hypothetical protein